MIFKVCTVLQIHNQALNSIDHLIRNGSTRMIDDARDRIEKLRGLQEFSFKEQQYERGNGSMYLMEIN